MPITRFEISSFRNIHSLRIEPSPGVNLVSGDNASGKSSLLEAIYYAANARSFRTPKISNLINSDDSCFTLFAEIIAPAQSRAAIGLKRCRDGSDITRINGTTVNRRSELLEVLPIQLISPESLSLLIDSAERRRSYMDWGLFHVEQTFHDTWRQFSRSLKQRNALLRAEQHHGLKEWSTLFLEHSEALTTLRRGYIDTLLPHLAKLLEKFLPNIEIDIYYQQGWPREKTLAQALDENLEQEQKLKYTLSGPQRADLLLKHCGKRVTEIFSRGQMKLIVVSMLLAQMRAMMTSTNHPPIVLVDDLAAELDVRHREIVMEALHDLGTQLFVTTPDRALIDTSGWHERKMFHVKHGEIKEML